ncbi:hypothetical protein D1BOALGB6SA_5777 [Olavius sp. associated proteobacterium Delta 1]|nr:hypothetical protein D1BOALGB6SA_5777 [Olavius sp. associated proteobacterium Delta 1]
MDYTKGNVAVVQVYKSTLNYVFKLSYMMVLGFRCQCSGVSI